MTRRRFGLPAVLAGIASLLGCGGAVPPAGETPRFEPEERVVVIAEEAPPGAPAARRRLILAEPLPSPADEARPHIEEAKQHALRFEFHEARQAINRARAVLEERAGSEADFEALRWTLAYRARVESDLQNTELAERALRDAARISSSPELDARAFPSDLVERFAAIHRDQRARPLATLTITVEPAEARIALDGGPWQRAPVTLRAIEGAHYVRAEALGHSPRVLRLSFDPDGTGQLRLALPELEDETALALQVFKAGDDALQSLGRDERNAFANVFDATVLVRVEDNRYLAVDLRSGRSAGGDVRDDDFVDEALGRLTPASETIPETADEGSSVGSSPWLWIAVGMVAVGAAIGTYFLATQDPEPEIRISTE
ncbi:MAG: PEGA domain-containing protein [Myxococcota bacterium]